MRAQDARRLLVALWVGLAGAQMVGCGTSSLRTGEVAQTFVAPVNDKEVVPLSTAADNPGEPIRSGESFVVTLRQVYLRYLSDPGFPNEVLVIACIDDDSGVVKERPLGLFEKVRDGHKLNFRDEIIYQADNFTGKHLKLSFEIYEVDANPIGGKKFYRVTRDLANSLKAMPVYTNKTNPEAAAVAASATDVLREANKDDVELNYSETFGLNADPRLREGTYVAVKQQYRPRAFDAHTKFLAGALTLWYAPGDTPDQRSWEPIDPTKLRVYNGEVLRDLTEEEARKEDPKYQPTFWEKAKDFTSGIVKKPATMDYGVHEGYKEYRDKTHIVFTIRRKGETAK